MRVLLVNCAVMAVKRTVNVYVTSVTKVLIAVVRDVEGLMDGTRSARESSLRMAAWMVASVRDFYEVDKFSGLVSSRIDAS